MSIWQTFERALTDRAPVPSVNPWPGLIASLIKASGLGPAVWRERLKVSADSACRWQTTGMPLPHLWHACELAGRHPVDVLRVSEGRNLWTDLTVRRSSRPQPTCADAARLLTLIALAAEISEYKLMQQLRLHSCYLAQLRQKASRPLSAFVFATLCRSLHEPPSAVLSALLRLPPAEVNQPEEEAV